MKLYLDVCCLNRPFDGQSQNRVRLEAEAVLSILEMAEAGELEIIGSDIIDDDMLRSAKRAGLKVKIENPAKWLIQETTDENGHAQSR